MTRLSVKKTYKLYIGGAFPRSESGRTFEAGGHNVARASRKDARDAVRAARSALPGWAALTAYNRGQVLYRLAEMMESRAADLEAACSGRAGGRGGDRSHRLVRGLGGQARPGDRQLESSRGAVLRLHDPGADRGRRDHRASDPPLLGLVSRTLPALVGGNTVVVVAGDPAAIAAVELAEALATSDFPGGSVNVLTGFADELAPWLAGHMDVNAIDVTGVDGPTVELERSAAENVKRVIRCRRQIPRARGRSPASSS